ncbi:hypothetical protein [Kribbella sp. NBC_00889]|uniref:hypothetical protein n=1 Tax=Kribbella sp. NBC_00889 TaxID=2975974 RepID=UPI0038675E0A|nr:hypothetical protein OG817_07720 [Kribbella sp. NBC_00889]
MVKRRKKNVRPPSASCTAGLGVGDAGGGGVAVQEPDAGFVVPANGFGDGDREDGQARGEEYGGSVLEAGPEGACSAGGGQCYSAEQKLWCADEDGGEEAGAVTGEHQP